MKVAAIFSKASAEWSTPEHVERDLYREFALDFDPCPIDGARPNGLFYEWHGRAFVNPPYKHIEKWIDKALVELRANRIQIAVFLLPSRTGTKWWHQFVMPYASEIRFLRGRLKFGGVGVSAPFDSVVVVFQ